MPRWSLPIVLGVLGIACAPAAPAPVAPPNPPPPASSAPAITSEQPKPPRAEKRPVVDVYHGVSVSDDYRWLENANDPEVQRWSDAENAYAEKVLGALAGRDAIRARVGELLGNAGAHYFALVERGARLFALEDHPPKQQPFLVVMKSADDSASERVVVDPNALDPSGKTSIDFFVPSFDGKKVAVSLSQGGTESGTLHVFDVDSTKQTGDVVSRVNGGTAGGSVAWSADDKSLYLTRYPKPGERKASDLDFYQQIYVHRLGTPESDDRYSVGKDFPRIAETELESSHDGRYLLASVANGDGGEFSHYLLGPSGKWLRLTDFADQVIAAHFGRDGRLYLLSRAGAPRGKLLRLDLRTPELARAQTVVEESDAVIQRFVASANRIYVVDLVGGPSRVRVFASNGKALPDVPIPPVSSVRGLALLDSGELLFENESYTNPPAVLRFDPKSGKTEKTALFQTSPADFSDAEVTRQSCTSKDGTAVPMTLLAKKGAPRDGKTPTLMTGYGGYGVSRTPHFRAISRLWLDHGGVFVTTNLRGGGEFGEAWHRAGYREKKQNVFDDFAACAERLFQTRVTRPDELAIIGGSNGGLLMGAELVQHPEMFRAVVSFVGIYDMLRVETTPNGAFNVTEYGSVQNPSEFQALLAYSPYQNVKDGVAYPATLMLTGKNDPRVDPYNSRKMVARLQAATGGKAPILLRTHADTGHGISNSLSEEIAEDVDVYSFLFAQLGN